MTSILKFNHTERDKAKVIRTINSCTDFNHLIMAYKMMENFYKIYYPCGDMLFNSDCGKEYINKYKELKPKDEAWIFKK